ncbi:MAG: hypothetical protein H0T78_07540 [Longispora sp.]|nr:hypothetical protein [Longispora sp. (in: high G+C Gram-positive bacteria)]
MRHPSPLRRLSRMTAVVAMAVTAALLVQPSMASAGQPLLDDSLVFVADHVDGHDIMMSQPAWHVIGVRGSQGSAARFDLRSGGTTLATQDAPPATTGWMAANLNTGFLPHGPYMVNVQPSSTYFVQAVHGGGTLRTDQPKINQPVGGPVGGPNDGRWLVGVRNVYLKAGTRVTIEADVPPNADGFKTANSMHLVASAQGDASTYIRTPSTAKASVTLERGATGKLSSIISRTGWYGVVFVNTFDEQQWNIRVRTSPKKFIRANDL